MDPKLTNAAQDVACSGKLGSRPSAVDSFLATRYNFMQRRPNFHDRQPTEDAPRLEDTLQGRKVPIAHAHALTVRPVFI